MRPLGEDAEWPGTPNASVAFRPFSWNLDPWNPCECAPMHRACAPARPGAAQHRTRGVVGGLGTLI